MPCPNDLPPRPRNDCHQNDRHRHHRHQQHYHHHRPHHHNIDHDHDYGRRDPQKILAFQTKWINKTGQETQQGSRANSAEVLPKPRRDQFVWG